MTFAWYAHLQNLADRPWYVAAIVSWGIALFEYLLQVPANRIGYTQLSLRSSRSCRRSITLTRVRAVRGVLHAAAAQADYLWAALCIVGAVYFVFRTPATP